MSFIRSTALRASSFARVARPTRFARTAELQPWRQAVQRRTYASGHGAHGPTKTSDAPWMATAVVTTVVGLYVIVNQDMGHGEEHGDHGDHHEKHEEAPAEEEPAEEESKEESNEEPKDESKDESKKEEPKKEEPKEDKSQPKKDTPEETSTHSESAEVKADSRKAEKKQAKAQASQEESKDEPGHPSPAKSDKVDEPDANQETSPTDSDQASPRKPAKSTNETSGKQEGMSNADTHHSTNISDDPNKSKKGEGVAETAKLKGTVSTERPGAENKEQRGKDSVDKEA